MRLETLYSIGGSVQPSAPSVNNPTANVICSVQIMIQGWYQIQVLCKAADTPVTSNNTILARRKAGSYTSILQSFSINNNSGIGFSRRVFWLWLDKNDTVTLEAVTGDSAQTYEGEMVFSIDRGRKEH